MKILIPLNRVKDRLGYSDDDADPDLQAGLLQAQKVIIDYLEVADDAYDTTLPEHIEVAMLLVLDSIKHRPTDDPIKGAVESILMRTRVPTLA